MSLPEITFDFETRSTVDLRKTGVDVYAAHPSTDIWILSFAVGEEPVERVYFDTVIGDDGQEHTVPRDTKSARRLKKLVAEGAHMVAHNTYFELRVWHHIMHLRHGWPELPVEQTACTMIEALALGLPGGLDQCSKVLNLPVQKDREGHALMMRMARPRRVEADGKVVWWNEPEKLERLCAYCDVDVEAERHLKKELRPLSASEREMRHVDYAINTRGVQLDRDFIEAAKVLQEKEQKRLNDELRKLTNGAVAAASNVSKLTAWIREQGVEVHTLRKADVEEILVDGNPSEKVKRALEIRQQVGKSSTKKLNAMTNAASEDWRARGLLQMNGAGTGRWAGRRVQPQNLPRPKIKPEQIEKAIAAIVKGKVPPKELGEPLTVLSWCLRGALVAGPGKELIAGDLRNIEGRVLAWLAGEEWKLEAFREFDAGDGPDIYKATASEILGKDVDDLTDDERQGYGKVPELALGYQGGVNAFMGMADLYGVNVTAEEADNIKVRWRDKHPATVDYWYGLERAAFDAVAKGGTTQAGDIPVRFRKSGRWLFCQLPSGRVLAYAFPRIGLRSVPWSKKKQRGVQYEAWDGMKKRWDVVNAYGGHWAENVTQATARDVLAGGIKRCEAKGYKSVLHVHDENVAEVPVKFGSVKEFERLMVEREPWTGELPVSVGAWRGKRYRKD